MNVEFDRLNALKAAWGALQPLTPENEARLWKKFRLLRNYHSNHIEGNTLTYGETELLLLRDQAIGNHGHRDYLEMKAHDLGIEHVGGLVADLDRLITESDIRDLNKIIHNQRAVVSNPYSKPILAEEADKLTAEILASTFASIKAVADEKMPNTGK
jgi:Fic family protein